MFNSWEKERGGGRGQNKGRSKKNTHYVNPQ
jgi:hypothetical protein